MSRFNAKAFFSFHILSKVITFLTTIIITRQMKDASLKGRVFNLTVFKAFIGMIVGREAFYSSHIRRGIHLENAMSWIFICGLLLSYLVGFAGRISLNSPTHNDSINIGHVSLSNDSIYEYIISFLAKFFTISMEEQFTMNLFFLSIVLEFFTDLFMIESQYREAFHIRIRTESIALFIKGVAMSIYLVWVREINGIQIERAFVFSEIGYSLSLLLFYFQWFQSSKNEFKEKNDRKLKDSNEKREKMDDRIAISEKNEENDLNPESETDQHLNQPETQEKITRRYKSSKNSLKESSSELFSRMNHEVAEKITISHSWWSDLKLFVQFYGFDTFRFLLQEGEKLALVWSGTLHEQGIFDMVSNLGSLVVRIVFLPIEQYAFASWSKSLHLHFDNQLNDNTIEKENDYTKEKENGNAMENQNLENIEAGATLEDAYALLQLLLKLLSIIATYFLCFGPPFSKTLLLILFGSRWAETKAPFLLQLYSVYIAFVALNGISEAFVRAAATGSILGSYSRFMTFLSILYATSCIGLTYLGLQSEALILSSILIKLLRTIYSFWFIHNYFEPYRNISDSLEPSIHKNTSTIKKSTQINEGNGIDESTKRFKRSLKIGSTFNFIPNQSFMLWCIVSFILCKGFEFVSDMNITRKSYSSIFSNTYISQIKINGRGIHLALGLLCFIQSVSILLKKEKIFFKKLLSFRNNA